MKKERKYKIVRQYSGEKEKKGGKKILEEGKEKIKNVEEENILTEGKNYEKVKGGEEENTEGKKNNQSGNILEGRKEEKI